MSVDDEDELGATPHEWFSFVDDDGDTWLFDVTFLASPWQCIFGHGCVGVLTGPAPELEQGCCSYGAHLVDEEDTNRVAEAAARLDPNLWQFAPVAAEGGLFGTDDGATVTRQVDDACIFLNRSGFDGGLGCALHLGAVAAGERPLDWKPAVCWQLPLRLEERADENDRRTFVLREWSRGDWGEGGAEFHWWCTEDDLAFGARRLVYETLRDEIVELVGDEPYRHLVAYLTRRPRARRLPHPARRRPHEG